MIVSVCADKGSPGVTTLATALSVVWPGEKVLAEVDPSGADLPFRLRRDDSQVWLAAEPSISSLAAVARLGVPRTGWGEFAQLSTLGVPVIPGALTAERFAPLRALWPQIAQVLGSWPGTVIADLGRLQPGHAAAPVAAASAVVLLLARADLGGLFHLRERVVELAQTVGSPGQDHTPLAVVITGPGKSRSKAIGEVTSLLASIGSPVPAAGFIPEDRQAAQDLWTGLVTRRLAGSELMRAVRRLAEDLLAGHPDLLAVAAEVSSGPEGPRDPLPPRESAIGAPPLPEGASR